MIRWGCPVPAFGDLSNARIATLGLNPSNREFVDDSGNELQGSSRRFHTLKSLGLKSWSDVDARHLHKIMDTCRTYFSGNPYNQWFMRLDHIVAGAGASYYGMFSGACHLDLIPYATECKWTALSARQRTLLLEIAGDTLALLLRDSPVQVLILNGMSVVQQFQDIAGISLERHVMPTWSLRRKSKQDVTGVAFSGVVETLAGIPMGRQVLVLGYNHNLQSSFGVTMEVVQGIREWVSQVTEEAIK